MKPYSGHENSDLCIIYCSTCDFLGQRSLCLLKSAKFALNQVESELRLAGQLLAKLAQPYLCYIV